jgi:hypothetical protein
MRRAFLPVIAMIVGAFLLGCGSKAGAPRRAAGPPRPPKPRADLEDFDPLGRWRGDNNEFEFTTDGKFARNVTHPNAGIWWEGEWRRQGGAIYAKYTRGTAGEVGVVTIFDIQDQDTIAARGWGVFKRKKTN